MSRSETGRAGESLAQEILAREGYRIVATNHRYARGEIDLIGMDGSVLAFIEVKTRRSRVYGAPAEAVDPRKRSHLVAAARHYLYTRRIRDQQCRFDVLSIFLDGEEQLRRYELIRDAFQVKGGNYF